MNLRLFRAHAIRFLAMDAVQKAQSGHPGMPMGMADIAEVLWHDFLKHDPSLPAWWDRDRFVLSNGHGSMLLYALLHLTGYDLSLDDLKDFRQLHSKTAGHPECDITPGVETSTGPLGQGLANAVGMALAEKIMAAKYNRENLTVIDHHTYVFLGDGCLMEGISHEVCSLAGTWKLGKLIAFWDDNGISIDGKTVGWFTDNTIARFVAYGWQVIADVDGHDPQAIANAITLAKGNTQQPTLIACRTIIGFGAANVAGTEKVHGSPLGDAAIAAVREKLQWPYAPFEIPKNIRESWDARVAGKQKSAEWQQRWQEYQTKYPTLAHELKMRMQGELPELAEIFATLLNKKIEKPLATRVSSQHCLNALGPNIPALLGGSADLSGSNGTLWSGAQIISAENSVGEYIHYGVREFGMFAIMNGLTLHGGFIPYGGTFLTFVDYGRNAVRMAALMRQRVIFVLTHDSIGLGEDGPTHQPIEHAAILRLTPHVNVWRPCDWQETVVAWQSALNNHQGPTCLLLSRQNCAEQTRTSEQTKQIIFGAYILFEPQNPVQIILMATGSEVELAVSAAKQLQQHHIAARVVSMPSTSVFEQQSAEYREKVLPQKLTKRIAIEAASADFWYKYVGLEGKIIGLHDYGLSAKAEAIFETFGITVDNIVETALSWHSF